jgi:hypothetical protein
MAGRECYHCKQWVEEGEEHDCWTTTETALAQDLSGDLQDAWERLRETAASFGDQRIYASHKSVMFSRKSCYFFVRPKRNFLEICVFLGRTLKAPQVGRAGASIHTAFCGMSFGRRGGNTLVSSQRTPPANQNSGRATTRAATPRSSFEIRLWQRLPFHRPCARGADSWVKHPSHSRCSGSRLDSYGRNPRLDELIVFSFQSPSRARR